MIMAIGNDPNPVFTRATPGIEVSKWGTIVADPETGATSRVGVYAGGDIVRQGQFYSLTDSRIDITVRIAL